MITKPTNWDNLINQRGRYFETCIVVGAEGQNAQVINGDKIAKVPYGVESLCGNNLDCGKATIQEKTFILKNVAQGSWEKHTVQRRWNRYGIKTTSVEENLGEKSQSYSRYTTTYGVKTTNGKPTIVNGKYSGWSTNRTQLPTSASGANNTYWVADANGIRIGTVQQIMNTDLIYFASNLRDFAQSGMNRTVKFDLTKLTATTECDYDDPQGAVVGEPGAYPDNGIQGDYWYVLDPAYQAKGSLIDIVYSINIDAYPTNGIQDGFWYVFLSIQSVIKRGDRLAIWKRVVLGTQKSNWKPCGIYYANKPETNTLKDAYGRVHSTTTFSAYDSMAALNYEPYSSTITDWDNKASRVAAQEICTQLGLTLEDSTQVPTTPIPAPPYGFSARQIFEDIATGVCGNWILTYVDTSPSGQTHLSQVPKLKLKRLANPDTVNYCNIGVHARPNYELGELVKPITHVILHYGTNDNGATLTKEAVAAVDNGRTLEKTLSIYTDGDIVQTIADTILSEQSGVTYQPLTCNKAIFDLCYELGDTANLDGHFFIITKKEEGQDAASYTNLQAVDIVSNEEQYAPNRQTQELKRDYATTKARISVLAGIVELEAERVTELGSTVANLSVAVSEQGGQISGIVQSVSALGSTVASLGITVDSQGGQIAGIIQNVGSNGAVTAASIVAAINGAESTVKINAAHIVLTGIVTIEEATQIAQDEADDRVAILEGEMADGTTVIDGNCIITDTLALNTIRCRGTVLTVKSSGNVVAGYLGYAQGYDGSSYTNGIIIKADDYHYLMPTTGGVRMQSNDNFLYISNNYTVLKQNKAYGTSLPTGGTEGAIFFLLD